MAFLLSSGIAVSNNNINATYLSGGASGSTSFVISSANTSIIAGQEITGVGFQPNTKVTSVSGTTINFSPAATEQISGTINFKTWYYLTDHNRSEIQINPILIEKEQRMANGTLRKFVISKKDIISTSWKFLPTDSKNKTATVKSVIANQSTSTIQYTTSSKHYFKAGTMVTVSGLSSFNVTKIAIDSVNTEGTTFTVKYSNTGGSLSGTTGTATNLNPGLGYNSPIVDDNYGASWISAFYNANVGNPIYLKIVSASHDDPSIGQIPEESSYKTSSTGSRIYQVFISNFSKSIIKRTAYNDFVDIDIEFTEI